MVPVPASPPLPRPAVHPGEAHRARYRSCAQVAYHLRVVLSVLAHEGSGETDTVFRLGAGRARRFDSMALLPREQCSVAAFSRAVSAGRLLPLLKPRDCSRPWRWPPAPTVG